MTIAFIASASNTASSGTALSVTHGFTCLAGDVVIAVVGVNGTATTTSDGGAFDNDDSQQFNSNSGRVYIYSRVCTGSEGATFDWTVSASNRWGVAVHQFRGVAASVYDVTPAVGNFTDTTNDYVLPNITVVDGAMAIAASAADVAGNGYNSIDNSYINFESPGTNFDVMMANRLYATGVTTSNTTVDVNDAFTDTGSWHFSLLPAASGNPWYHYAQQQIGQ